MAINLIHSDGIPPEYLQGLDRLLPGLARTALAASKDVYDSISSHPDISIFDFDHKIFVVSPQAPADAVRALKGTGARVITSGSTPHGKYPDTAPLNAVRVGKFVIHNTLHTDRAIKALVEEFGLELIFVNQGYSRCSTIPVGERAIITCDAGISKAASTAGLEVELISQGSILLEGQRHGFIGGASGVLPDGRIVFLGDVRKHPDHEAILSFIGGHGAGYLHIEGLDLFDAGSLIFFIAE